MYDDMVNREMGEGGGVGFGVGVGRGGEEGKRWVGIEIGAALDSGGFFVVGDFVRGFGRGFGDEMGDAK